MAFGILEVPGVPAPERVGCWLENMRACFPGLNEDFIHCRLALDVVRESEFRRRARTRGQPRVVREVATPPQRELHAALQLEERDSALLVVSALNPFGCQSEP